ncbi:MAG: SUMF1/EgtB/PvdO family nonheme iron enzyme, partial [Candidatus Delongbacteria bacterium]
MICPKCNTMNPNSIKKCIKCGEKLEKTTGGAGSAKPSPSKTGPMLKRKEKPPKTQKVQRQPRTPREGGQKSRKGFMIVLLILLVCSYFVWENRDYLMEYVASGTKDSLDVAEVPEEEDIELFREERRSKQDSLLYQSLSDAEKAQQLKKKKTYNEKYFFSKDGKRMVLIPGQTFTMGSDNGSDLERPAHKQRVIDFYMDETEVTNLQFKKFLEETNYKPKGSLSHLRDRKFNRDDMPVVNVNYEDALAYAKWSDKRLPTEIEWECAAKGGNNFEYPTGEDLTESQARFGMNITVGSTAPVKAYKPSVYGLYGLAGNASEWVRGVLYQYPGNEIRSRY